MPDLLINRRDPTVFELRDSVKPTIKPGQAVLALDRFGLTSNNVTYVLTGNAMGYWRYFPADEGWGRMPVWGFAEVIETASNGLPAGTRLSRSGWVARPFRRSMRRCQMSSQSTGPP